VLNTPTLAAAPLRIAGIEPESIVDGPGVRAVLFMQGCPHHCPGCHNSHTHNPQGGTLTTVGAVVEQLLRQARMRAVTLSGGEPFFQAHSCTLVAQSLRAEGFHLTCFSGYTWEALTANAAYLPLLHTLDLLIDGPYIAAQRSLELRFRGSSNQRIIDVPRSLQAGHIVLSAYQESAFD
jgi:anaerobic ribonucleoside-triphosphate reductase activating protein